MSTTRFAVIMAAVLMAVCTLGATAQAEMNDINGTWQINAVLISTTQDDGPQPGYMKQDVWQITQQGNYARLTTQAGSVDGQFVPQTQEFPMGAWVFRLEVPNLMNQPNLGGVFETVIAGGPTSNYIQGGSSVTYYSGVSGQWVPIGMESWRFEAYR